LYRATARVPRKGGTASMWPGAFSFKRNGPLGSVNYSIDLKTCPWVAFEYLRSRYE
jgi:hypothetical protein